MLEVNISRFLTMMTSTLLAAFYQVIEGVRRSQSDILLQLSTLSIIGKEMRIELARRLMESIKPEVIELKPGEIKRISNDLIVEKTLEGEIIIYAVSGE